MESKVLAWRCRELAEDKKAENPVVLDMREVSSVTDYFVIISASNEPQLRAIAHEIRDKLRNENRVRPRATDGNTHASWIVMDFFDVIVHIMRSDLRELYDLENLWGDAPRMEA